MSAENKIATLFRRVRRLQSLLVQQLAGEIFTDALSLGEYLILNFMPPFWEMLEEITWQTYLAISIVGISMREIMDVLPELMVGLVYKDSLNSLKYLYTTVSSVETVAMQIDQMLLFHFPKYLTIFENLIMLFVAPEVMPLLGYLHLTIETVESMNVIIDQMIYFFNIKYTYLTDDLGILFTTGELMPMMRKVMLVIKDITQPMTVTVESQIYFLNHKYVPFYTEMWAFIKGDTLLTDFMNIIPIVHLTISPTDGAVIGNVISQVYTTHEQEWDYVIELFYTVALTLYELMLVGKLLNVTVGSRDTMDVTDTIQSMSAYLSPDPAWEYVVTLRYLFTTTIYDALSILPYVSLTVQPMAEIISASAQVSEVDTILTIGGELPDLDCRLWLPFNEGTLFRAKDWTINYNDATLSPSAGWEAGQFGYAFSGDGNNSVATVIENGSMDFTNTVSMSGWILQSGNATSTYQRITDKNGKITCWVTDESSSPSGNFAIRLGGTSNPGPSSQVNFVTGLEQNRPYFFAWTYDKDASQRLSLWIDGELFGTSNYYSGTMATNNDDLSIGNWSPTTRPWLGYIDELMIFNDPFTDEIVADMYRRGPPLQFLDRLIYSVVYFLFDTLSIIPKIMLTTIARQPVTAGETIEYLTFYNSPDPQLEILEIITFFLEGSTILTDSLNLFKWLGLTVFQPLAMDVDMSVEHTDFVFPKYTGAIQLDLSWLINLSLVIGDTVDMADSVLWYAGRAISDTLSMIDAIAYIGAYGLADSVGPVDTYGMAELWADGDTVDMNDEPDGWLGYYSCVALSWVDAVPHVDDPPHSNHTDEAYGFTSHSDATHSNQSHSDSGPDTHSNRAYLDDPHSESHGDSLHSNRASSYHSEALGHSDQSHSDSAAHSDYYDDPHGNLSYSDATHSNISHSNDGPDTYSDRAHRDDPYVDGGPHVDTLYGFIPEILHSEIPHVDIPHSEKIF